MSNKFEFKLPNGVSVRTGNIAPSVKLTSSFKEYPESSLMTDDEIRQVLSNPNRKRSRKIYTQDWILNQGRRSSCNAYACAGAMMRLRNRKGLKRKEFAPEFLYMQINDGQDQGSHLEKGLRAGTEIGMPLKGTVPFESYSLDQLNMETKRFAGQEASNYRYLEAYALPCNNLETLWRAAITATLRREQLVLAVHVGSNYMQSPTGTWAEAGFDDGPGNHAVGADDAIAADNWNNIMDIRIDQYGSWTPSHGEKGRVLINPRHLDEPSNYHTHYAIRSIISEKE